MLQRVFLLAAALLLLCAPAGLAKAASLPYDERYALYAAAYPELSEAELTSALRLKLDEPNYQNVVIVIRPASLGVLVSKHYALPKGYLPVPLVTVDEKYAMSGVQLRADCCSAYLKMARAMEAQGLTLYIKSGYRVNKTNDDPDDMWNAWPGHSEHQTGLAFDLRLKGEEHPNLSGYKYERSPEYAWLCVHAYEYGFVLSYPEGETAITGYKFEPWHWRYVGAGIASDMKKKGFSTFPEYWAAYLMKNELRPEPRARFAASLDRPSCRFSCVYAEAK